LNRYLWRDAEAKLSETMRKEALCRAEPSAKALGLV
jgi:hypothetical protein